MHGVRLVIHADVFEAEVTAQDKQSGIFCGQFYKAFLGGNLKYPDFLQWKNNKHWTS